MTIRFTVLASGSAGNTSLVEVDGFGVLLDLGLGPKDLAARLEAAGHSTECIGAVLLTHTHTDHWNDRSLAWLVRRKLPLFCHPDHHGVLQRYSPAFVRLLKADLVRSYREGEPFSPAPNLRCLALPVRHDSGATFGFRLEGPADLFGRAAALAYAADLGTWNDELVERLSDVDLLAVEFNHDVGLERQSPRPAALIARVLGDEGHLSNDQAAALLRAVLERSTPGRLRHVVQLHLSQECNRPALARRAARDVLRELGHPVRVHTAEQDQPGKVLVLKPDAANRQRRVRTATPLASTTPAIQPWLPGLEPVEDQPIVSP
jgi:phosphoribosyl 1,2-cyclic phosphodiesterase